MLVIRLARVGKKKQVYFRVIVSEKTKDTHGDYLEMLGSVNPHTKPWLVQLKTERLKYWLNQGARVSPLVHNILVDQGVIQADKRRVWKAKKKPITASPSAAPVEPPSISESTPTSS